MKGDPIQSELRIKKPSFWGRLLGRKPWEILTVKVNLAQPGLAYDLEKEHAQRLTDGWELMPELTVDEISWDALWVKYTYRRERRLIK